MFILLHVPSLQNSTCGTAVVFKLSPVVYTGITLTLSTFICLP